MGTSFSHLFPCLNQASNRPQPDLFYKETEPLDETLGHSFCYVRSSARSLSPTPSDRFISPSHSLRFSPSHEPRPRPFSQPETAFRTISGASVSANTATPRTVLELENIYDDATDYCVGGGVKSSIVNGFESTSSFSSITLQPLPRGCGTDQRSGPIERAFFMSGPMERGALSGPLEPTAASSDSAIPFSAPLGGGYVKSKRRKGISGIRKAFNRSFDKKRPWVVPVGRKDVQNVGDEAEIKNEGDTQWALGKAGEDRVHVVVSEEQGWLFVGIYDGFNGPDAPEFLMGNLYKAVFKELQGLFWDCVDEDELPVNNNENVVADSQLENKDSGPVNKVAFQSEEIKIKRRRLWEFLAEEDLEEGLDLSGSDRFAFSVDDAVSVSNARSAVSRRSLLLSKIKHGLIKHQKESSRKLFPWRFPPLEQEKDRIEESVNRVVEETRSKNGKIRKVGPVDHELVLSAISRALECTEIAYLDMTHKVLDRNPELALMGSCLLVVLMRDEDVYVMNLGDSRAIVAQHENLEVSSSTTSTVEGIIEESVDNPRFVTRLNALQLSTDHSTSIEEEVLRIKNEHPDDCHCIVNGRVKGRLKVTRAFGAGFLKQPELNDVLLEMFRNEYIGTKPYISCLPSLRHHKLCARDQFLVLSSDGLYQYLTNQEVVSYIANFIQKFPEGDPAQHLIEELLLRAAKKAGMDLHELIDIPQGDRRKYHDDITVMIISLEGRIWKSSGKYL